MRIQGLDYEYFPAVDGKKLSQEDIDSMGIRQLPGFSDPHHPRTVTRGEVGCFLSHYRIWEEMKVGDIYLVLEDDVRFGTNFVTDLKQVLEEAKTIKNGWDLIYVGRKRGPGAGNDDEYMVTDHISSGIVPLLFGKKIRGCVKGLFNTHHPKFSSFFYRGG